MVRPVARRPLPLRDTPPSRASPGGEYPAGPPVRRRNRMPGQPSPGGPVQWFGELAPTWFAAGPTLLRRILEKLRDRTPGSAAYRLRFVASAGALLPQPLQEALEDSLGVPILEYHASSEAGHIASNTVHAAPRPGTCGDVRSGHALRRRRRRTEARPGRNRRGPCARPQRDRGLPRQSRGKPDRLRRRMAADRRSRPDCRRRSHPLRPQQGGHQPGRGEDLPAEIDRALLSNPAVKEAAAFARPHARLGEDVAAAIVPAAGDGDARSRAAGIFGGSWRPPSCHDGSSRSMNCRRGRPARSSAGA